MSGMLVRLTLSQTKSSKPGRVEPVQGPRSQSISEKQSQNLLQKPRG